MPLYQRKYNCCLEIPEFYYKGIQRLFEETRLNLPIDLRETLIFERLFYYCLMQRYSVTLFNILTITSEIF